MGQILQRYLEQNQQQLEEIVLGKPNVPPGGISQPGGGSTFPAPTPPSVTGEPTFGAAPPGEGIVQAQAPTAAPVSALDPETVQKEGPGLTPRPPEPEAGEDKLSFDDMIEKADNKQIDEAINQMEKSSGVPIDQAYQNATGQPPAKGMSRRDKGQLLMEFGLNLMARSGSGEGNSFSDIGFAGLDTMQAYRDRKAAEAEAARQAGKEDREIEELEIRKRVAEAQLEKAKRDNKEIKTNEKGELMIVNIDAGTATVITDQDGNPVGSDPDQRERYASEVDRMTYEAEFCEGLEKGALKTCKRRAVAYAKGVREVAFPGVLRADQTERVMVNLEKPDNASIKYQVTGELKRWRDMTPDEQMEVATRMVDRRIEIIEAGGIVSGDKKPRAATPTEAGGQEDEIQAMASKMETGKIYTLSDGKEYRLRNGRVELVQ